MPADQSHFNSERGSSKFHTALLQPYKPCINGFHIIKHTLDSATLVIKVIVTQQVIKSKIQLPLLLQIFNNKHPCFTVTI